MPKFTIRVYGLWLNQFDEYLISDERIGEHQFTKFPGGGLEKGEGTIDCLKREWQEELGVEITHIEHFYTTDFYVPSAFHDETQVISVYYKVEPVNFPKITFKSKAMNFTMEGNREENFRFMRKEDMHPRHFTFPIDKEVAEMLSAS